MDPNQDTVSSVKGLLKLGADEDQVTEEKDVSASTEEGACDQDAAEDKDDSAKSPEMEESLPLSPVTKTPSKLSYLSVDRPARKKSGDLTLPPPSPGPMGDSADAQTTQGQRRVTFARKRDIVNIELDSFPGGDNGPASPKSTGSASTESSEVSKARRVREFKMKICIGLLFAFMVTGVALIFHFYHAKQLQITMGKRLVYKEKSRDIVLYNHQRKRVLEGILGLNLHQDKLPAYCTGERKGSGNVNNMCLIWKDLATLQISSYEEDEVSCYNVSWQSNNPDLLLQDCFSLNDSWYGAGVMYEQRWPLNTMSMERMPFLAGTIHDQNSMGPVLEPYFLSSAGVSIMVDQSVPLHLSLNAAVQGGNDSYTTQDNKLCLYADTTNTPYPNTKLPHLSYTVCVAPDVSSVHELSLTHFAGAAHQGPDQSLTSHPVWSTMPYLRDNLTQRSITDFVDHIVAQGYSRSMLVIDGDWELTMGSFQFDPVRFPDPKVMIENIQSHGFRVSLMVHPYVNYDSHAFQFCVEEGLLVTDSRGEVPGLTKWWLGPPQKNSTFGIAGVVDVTSSGATWLEDRVANLSQTLNVDSFYWYGGQTDMQPAFPTFADNISTPNIYLTRLADLGASLGNARNQQLQSGFKSQHASGIIRMYGHQSSWNLHGLESIIPHVLSLGIMGYPYILPDVIGGNAYGARPSRELYIRWMQLTAFLPSAHFSIPPDAFDEDTKRIANSLIDLHQQVIAPRILKVTSEEGLLPTIRPLWLQWPGDSETFSLDSQFMVGKDILVAPILSEGLRMRDIYLPNGTWTDQMTVKDIQGPKWLRSVPVPINQIPYFILEN